jgi:hypothetical protein
MIEHSSAGEQYTSTRDLLLAEPKNLEYEELDDRLNPARNSRARSALPGTQGTWRLYVAGVAGVPGMGWRPSSEAVDTMLTLRASEMVV